MKKIFSLIVVILFFIILLVGCTDDERRDNNDNSGEAETGTYEDFIGTWTTLTGAGSFSEGNSIRFNNDDTFEKFWDHGGAALHSGTWEIKDILGENPKLILTQGEMSYTYNYSFYYSHTQLSLVPEGASSGTVYIRP